MKTKSRASRASVSKIPPNSASTFVRAVHDMANLEDHHGSAAERDPNNDLDVLMVPETPIADDAGEDVPCNGDDDCEFSLSNCSVTCFDDDGKFYCPPCFHKLSLSKLDDVRKEWAVLKKKIHLVRQSVYLFSSGTNVDGEEADCSNGKNNGKKVIVVIDDDKLDGGDQEKMNEDAERSGRVTENELHKQQSEVDVGLETRNPSRGIGARSPEREEFIGQEDQNVDGNGNGNGKNNGKKVIVVIDDDKLDGGDQEKMNEDIERSGTVTENELLKQQSEVDVGLETRNPSRGIGARSLEREEFIGQEDQNVDGNGNVAQEVTKKRSSAILSFLNMIRKRGQVENEEAEVVGTVKDNEAILQQKINSDPPSNSTSEVSSGSKETVPTGNELAKHSTIPRFKRKKLPWSGEEEEMLEKAVRKISAKRNKKNLSWDTVLNFGGSVFNERRNPVDLKEKWRRMQK